MTLRTAAFTLTIQYMFVITWHRPAWPKRLWTWRMSSDVTRLIRGRIIGCFVWNGKSPRLSRPPTLNIPLSRKGSRRRIGLLFFTLAFLRPYGLFPTGIFSIFNCSRTRISSLKADDWTNFRIANAAFTRSCTARGRYEPSAASRLASLVFAGVLWSARFEALLGIPFSTFKHLHVMSHLQSLLKPQKHSYCSSRSMPIRKVINQLACGVS